jgi:outer membrane protein assembly factor BamB
MGTACLDAETGKVLWTQVLPVDHLVGPGSSPVLYKDLLIVVRDGCDAQYVAALDKKTGQTAWKTPRPPIEARADMKKAFSTPLVVEAGGKTQMIAVGAHWAVGYDPATGKEIWRVRHGNGFSLAPRPVYGNGLTYICTGCLVAQLWAIRVDGQADVTGTHVAWKATEQIPILSSPILVGNEVYTISDQGRIQCFDAATGEGLWKHMAAGQYLASPASAEGRLYFFARDGKTTVLRAGRQLEKLAENKLDGPVSATPAFVGGTILVRTEGRLYCLSGKVP